MEIQIDRTLPSDKQTWREHLVLVSSLPSRFLGILPPEQTEAALNGKPFYLKKVAVYFCNLALQQTPKGVTLSTVPHTLLKYDLIDTLDRVDVLSAQHIIQVHLQSEVFKRWMEEQYTNLMDPPRVVAAGPLVDPGR